ncbi:FecR family protein [Spongiimicrobium salis]|uniref:FecR family protein n=1 Tax=Spongiimicrobium salis TaxID=1667022 RepID=UPI00374D7C72
MQENYLAKWLNNELSEEELEEFKKTDAYHSYQKIIAASETLEGPDFDMENTYNTIKAKRVHESSKVVSLSPIKKWSRIAAAVILLITGAYFFTNSLDKTVTTSYAEHSEAILPDASEIILNADSEISYNESKWDEDRSLTLDGEAFFKVAKGKKFTVQTTIGEVTVLGTQFNVEQRSGLFEVTCYEGLVRVTHNAIETELPAGSSFLVIDNDVKIVPPTKYNEPTWINDESSFTSIPLLYVLQEFERQYNISMDIKDIDTDQLFTGSFSNKNIDLALKSICVPSKIKFNLEDDKVLFYAKSEQ